MARKARGLTPTLPPRPRRWVWWVVGVPVGLIVLAGATFALLDAVGGNVLRKPVERAASWFSGRPVRIDDLEFKLFSLSPSARVEGLVVGNPGDVASGTAPVAVISRTDVALRLPALLKGDVRLPYLRLGGAEINLVRSADGSSNWVFEKKGGGGGFLVDQLLVSNGRFTLDDKQRNLSLSGTFRAEDSGGTLRRNTPFTATGRGLANGQTFRFEARGGSLDNVGDEAPYPFGVDITVGKSSIVAMGVIREPMDLLTFDGKVRLRGDDLAKLYPITGVTLPNTPPYDLAVALRGEGEVFRLTAISGRIGDSDMAGTGLIDLGRAKLYAKADLRTKRLDFDDLATLLGAPPAVEGGETASAEQKRQADRLRSEARLFPDAKLKVERLRTMDADVTYKADKVEMANVPLQSMDVTVKLKDAVLTIDPMRLGLANGTVSGNVRLDARSNTPAVAVDVRARRVDLATFFAAQNGTAPLQGVVGARVKVEGRGLSVREVASTADGQVTVVIPRGQMRRAFAELMGINLANGLGLLLSESQDVTEVSCGIADFKATNGMLDSRMVVLDTGPVLATGKGQINLGSETMDLRLEGHPKEVRVLRLIAPVTLKGRLRSPVVGVEATGSAAQVGGAVALGALLSPLAAILPFIDSGLADNVDCRALVARARAMGATR